MHIQSYPDLAIALERCVPGSICHAPKEVPAPVFRAFKRVLEFFRTLAMIAAG